MRRMISGVALALLAAVCCRSGRAAEAAAVAGNVPGLTPAPVTPNVAVSVAATDAAGQVPRVVFSSQAARLEKGTYLGVSTAPAGAALREQLGLPRGMGLVVQAVEPGSPAEAAGIRSHDVLLELGDQWLISPHQLTVLVRNRKPGEVVTFTALRRGAEVRFDATLVEKDVPALEEWVFGDSIRDVFIRVSPEQAVGGPQVLAIPQVTITPLPPASVPPAGPAGNSAPPTPPAAMQTVTVVHEARSLAISDAGRHIQLDIGPGGGRLRVVNSKTGETEYDGPFDTEADRAKAPADVLDSVRRLDPRIVVGTATPPPAGPVPAPAPPAPPPTPARPAPPAP